MLKVLLLVGVLFVADASYAGCGFQPFPPFGCQASQAQCVCSGAGCEWVFYGCK